MRAAWLNAAVPKPFEVLRRDLVAYTLGHDVLLQAYGCKFSPAFRGQPATVEDLLFGALICSMPLTKARHFLADGFSRLALRFWGHSCRGVNWVLEWQQFAAYISYFTALPGITWKDEGTGSSHAGTPFTQLLKITLMEKLGLSAQEALETSYKSAICDWLALAERAGTVSILSDKDEDDLRATEAFLAMATAPKEEEPPHVS